MSYSSDAIDIFFSYAHEDEALRDELAKHLRTLEQKGIIKTWHDRKIIPGSEWFQDIDQQLNSVQIILLLISPDFMASDFCWSVELKRAIERHNANEAHVIPIILRFVDWSDSPISKLQALPKDASPVTKWSDRDEAFFNITQGIKLAIKALKERIPSIPQATSPVRQLWIHGWKYGSYNGLPNAELDWTSHFDIDAKPHRKIASLSTWNTVLLPQLKQVREQITQRQANLTLEIQGALPLSAALTIGTIFQDTAVVYVEPETGTGEAALHSDADVIALALQTKDLIRHYRDRHKTKRTHLVLYTPMGFCLFLGSWLRLVGDVIAYERVAYGVYESSVELQTG